jgi:hypothetical protein
MRFRFCGDLDAPDWVLAEVATLSKMSSVRIKVVVMQILSYCLEGTFNTEKIMKLASDNAEGLAGLKGSVAAIHFVVTNAAKFDLDESSLVQEIQQLGLPRENSEAIARQYREHKDLLRTRLAEQSYRVSKLVSAEWRVDQVVASSSVAFGGAAKEVSGSDEGPKTGPLVHLKLTIDTKPQQSREVAATEGSGGIQELAFEVHPDKLDVLISDLEAARALMSASD